MGTCKEFANNKEEAFAHITEEDRDILRDEVQKTESWMNENISLQSKLASNVKPILTLDAISKQQNSLFKVSSPIMSKRKPKPVVVPTGIHVYLSICVYTYMCVYTCVCVCIHIYL